MPYDVVAPTLCWSRPAARHDIFDVEPSESYRFRHRIAEARWPADPGTRSARLPGSSPFAPPRLRV